MFGVEGTPFDLQFTLGRIPVRVLPTFWIATAYLGWNPDRLDLVMIWVLCVFFSILIHELGHALVAEGFGYPTEIILYHFGGLAAPLHSYRVPPFRSLMISLAGPFAQFFLAGLIFAAMIGYQSLDQPSHEYLEDAYDKLMWINIGFAVINLFPLFPLDGGQSLEALMAMAGVRSARLWALRISVLTGILGAVLMVNLGMTGVAIMFGLLVMMNVQMLQARAW